MAVKYTFKPYNSNNHFANSCDIFHKIHNEALYAHMRTTCYPPYGFYSGGPQEQKGKSNFTSSKKVKKNHQKDYG